jgi:hypothetical protein
MRLTSDDSVYAFPRQLKYGKVALTLTLSFTLSLTLALTLTLLYKSWCINGLEIDLLYNCKPVYVRASLRRRDQFRID